MDLLTALLLRREGIGSLARLAMKRPKSDPSSFPASREKASPLPSERGGAPKAAPLSITSAFLLSDASVACNWR